MGHGHHHYNATTEAPTDENALELGELLQLAAAMGAAVCLLYACGRLAFAHMVRRMAPQIKVHPEAPPPAYEPVPVDEKKETA